MKLVDARKHRKEAKNGFKQLNVRINEAGVGYELLGTDDSVTQADFLALMKEYAGALLYKFLYRKTVIEE